MITPKKVKRIITDNFSFTHHLDFGCGGSPRDPLVSTKISTVDTYKIDEINPSKIINPGEPIPFPDRTFTSFSAYDVIEHLGRNGSKNDFIFYMNELSRVLVKRGIGVIVFPAYPHKDAFSDPTHLNYATKETLNYFTAPVGGPYYDAIRCEYSIIVNQKLRYWKKWVDESELNGDNSKLSIRRRLSLAKRTFFRFINPGHLIWVVQKK